MKIALLGVTGDTGRELLDLALANGHDVVAIARTPSRVARTAPHLQVLQGDVMDAATLVAPLAACEVVVSCVGVSNPAQARRGTTVYSVGTNNLIAAMHQGNCRRIIAVSSAGVAPRKGAPIIYKLIVKPFFLEPAYRDMRIMEQQLGASELDWTVVRPPQLVDKPLRTDYRLQVDTNFDDDHPLPKASLAHFLLAEAESPRFVRHVVAISM